MAMKFSMMDMINDESRRQALKTGYEENVDIDDIEPSDMNFYGTADVTSLKESIYLIGLQNPVTINITHSKDGKRYRMISGHRRLKAFHELVREGHCEYGTIPAIIHDIADADEEKAILIMSNSTARELTGWEKVKQYMELKPTLEELKRKKGLKGRVRDIAAETLGVSTAQAATYNTIGTRLTDAIMGMFQDGGITMELALEAAKLPPDEQKKLYDIATSTGTFTKQDIKMIISSRPIDGQMSIVDNVDNNNIVNGMEEYKDSVSGSVNDSDSPDNTISDLDIKSCEDESINEMESSESTIQTDEDMAEITDKEAGAAAGKRMTYYWQGAYDLITVYDLIKQYESLTDRHVTEKIDRNNKCILDALSLLLTLIQEVDKDKRNKREY